MPAFSRILTGLGIRKDDPQLTAAGEGDKAFYEAKIKTAQFYFKKILPRTKGHVEAIDGGLDVLMQMDVESFAF